MLGYFSKKCQNRLILYNQKKTFLYHTKPIQSVGYKFKIEWLNVSYEDSKIELRGLARKTPQITPVVNRTFNLQWSDIEFGVIDYLSH